MDRARRARVSAVIIGLAPLCLGLYLLLHDGLIVAHLLQPYGDGPAGLIVGPFLILVGAIFLRRVHYLPDRD